MITPACSHNDCAKHGKDRKGNQRYKCRLCGHTFTSEEQRPLGNMRVDMADAVRVLEMLLEGMSIRACSRITGLKADTICDLIVQVGENCDLFLKRAIKNVAATEIQLDEIWDFVAMKSRTKERNGITTEDVGDSWTWLAIDANSKLVLSHSVGTRGDQTGDGFLYRLNEATTGPCQVTSDGYRCYTYSVPLILGSRASFAQLVKNYAATQNETRYSPATIVGIEKIVRFGNPDKDKISTSYSERLNLSLRMNVRRFTRLTNAHSKSARHHAAMVSLWVAWYNFSRPHMSLGKKVSPAMAAGITNNLWSIETLLRAAA